MNLLKGKCFGITKSKNKAIEEICGKIHVARQFFEASARQGDLIEKTKIPFLDKVNGSMCAEYQVCIVFSWARRRDP